MSPRGGGPGGVDVDVAVVGCGPVGVMHALRCAQRGLTVVAVDRATEIFPLPRAIGMDDEIQHLFERAGLLPQLQEVSTPIRGAEFVDADGERLVGFEAPEGTVGPLGLPMMTMFEQPLVEAFVREAAIAAGVDLRVGVEGVGLEARSDGVVLELRELATGVGQTVTARWLVGADGAASWVRKQVGVASIDQGFDQSWLVIDATALGPLDFPEIPRQICDPDRIVTLIPGHRTRRRWEFQLRPGETADEMLDPTRIAELLAPWGGFDTLRLDRQAVYRFHALVADRFRVGNVFLAGDAAHQMPPFNGQGMNTGMRDAENLAWKFAEVRRGRSGDALLDTYDAERRPHAAGQVEHSADAGRLIDALAAGHDVDTAAGYGGGKPFPHVEHGLVDGDHPWVGRPMRRLDGVELPPDGFCLLADRDPGDVADWWTDRGAAVVVAALPAEAAGRVVLVRPDRLVAAVTDDLARTTAGLAGHLTLLPTDALAEEHR